MTVKDLLNHKIFLGTFVHTIEVTKKEYSFVLCFNFDINEAGLGCYGKYDSYVNKYDSTSEYYRRIKSKTHLEDKL